MDHASQHLTRVNLTISSASWIFQFWRQNKHGIHQKVGISACG